MKITGLKKKLGTFFLSVEHLSLSRPGIYGLIGPNGSGKSTIAKLIMGIMSPDSGCIDLEGLSYGEITFLPPKPYMINDTVYNNLVYPLKLRKINPDPGLCNKYLDMIGFLNRQKQRAMSLSSGEQQKLSLLRALIFKPRLIIADEALTDLDMDSLESFEEIIRDTQTWVPETTWLIISHQLPHIRRLCEYLFFMNQGRLEAEGPAEEILSNPGNLHIRRYLRHEAFMGNSG